MRRNLFTLAAGVSAVLCVGVCVLWVRSYWHRIVFDTYGRAYDGAPLHTTEFWATAGRLSISSEEWDRGGPQKREFKIHEEPFADSADFSGGAWLAFRWDAPEEIKWDTRSLGGGSVPFWFVALASGALPGAWILRHRHRFGPGCCPACGYDLRATPERCPECGTAAGGVVR